MQGVSGMEGNFAREFGDSRSGLRLNFDIKPVDMKAVCCVIAALKRGVATGSLVGRWAPMGRDFEKFTLVRGLSPSWIGICVGESSWKLEPEDDDCVRVLERGCG